MNLEIFFAEVLANQVRRTYTTTKIDKCYKKNIHILVSLL